MFELLFILTIASFIPTWVFNVREESEIGLTTNACLISNNKVIEASSNTLK